MTGDLKPKIPWDETCNLRGTSILKSKSANQSKRPRAHEQFESLETGLELSNVATV
jgi:hypothetical protein